MKNEIRSGGRDKNFFILKHLQQSSRSEAKNEAEVDELYRINSLQKNSSEKMHKRTTSS